MQIKIPFPSALAMTTAICSTLALSSFSQEAQASPNTTINAVEVIMVIETDGTTTVDNQIEFNVKNGPLTALIVENMAINPTHFGPAKYELAGSSQMSETIITKTATKQYDIEATPKIPNGDAFLYFRYTGNIIRDGYIGLTESSDFGELYYFDWAPMQWRTGLKYRDIKIVLPVPVNGAEISDEEFQRIAGYSRRSGWNSGSSNALILTEKYVNQRNKIDYIGTDIGGGQYLLTMHVYQDDVAPRESQRIQFYMKPELMKFNSDKMRHEGDEAFNPDALEVPPAAGIGAILVIAAAGFGIMAGSARRRKREEERAKEIHTVGDEIWEAPELQVGSFGEGGKIAQNLHPVEVGLLLGMEIPQIIGILAQAMADDGKLIIQTLEPLCAYPAAGVTIEGDIENEFVEIFDETGAIDSKKLNEFLEKVITALQEKTWDCDLEATRKYYLDMLYENPDESDPTKLRYKYIDDKDFTSTVRPSRYDDYYWRHRRYWRHYNLYYTHVYHYDHGLPVVYNARYTDFIRSEACFHGCFNQPHLENVCHSACHSACHDACHSACHSACHHACHSACHSACVSGGSR